MKMKITDGIGTETEKEISTEEISGEDLLKQLGIDLFESMIMENI